MPAVNLTSSIQQSTQTLSNFDLERSNQLLETLNTNLSKMNLQLPNISSANITGDISNLDLNLTQSLNDDLLKTINDATGAISGITDAFNGTMNSFSDALKGMSGNIGGLKDLTKNLGDLTGSFDDLLNITDNLQIPGLDKLQELTGSLNQFLQQAEGLLNELGSFESALGNLVQGGAAESLVNRVDRTAANADFQLDNFNTITISDMSLVPALISNYQLTNGTIFKDERTRQYYIVVNESKMSLWDYNVNRVRNGQTPFKPRGAITDRVVRGVPVYVSSE